MTSFSCVVRAWKAKPPCPNLAIEGVDGGGVQHGGEDEVLKEGEAPRIPRLVVALEGGKEGLDGRVVV